MEPTQNIVIAIDGFSSCGKSTLAKDLSNHFHFLYIDTGAMYRCVTLYFLRQDVDIDNESEVIKALEQIEITFKKTDQEQHVYLNGEDVSELVRKPNISAFVSEVSTLSLVRRKLVQQQRLYGKNQNLIMDGRDIGTVVYPNANIKLFLTASEDIRANRRYLELIEKGITISLEEVKENVKKRDYIDSNREDSPLRKAEDATTIDNSSMSRVEQFQYVSGMINKELEKQKVQES